MQNQVRFFGIRVLVRENNALFNFWSSKLIYDILEPNLHDFLPHHPLHYPLSQHFPFLPQKNWKQRQLGSPEWFLDLVAWTTTPWWSWTFSFSYISFPFSLLWILLVHARDWTIKAFECRDRCPANNLNYCFRLQFPRAPSQCNFHIHQNFCHRLRHLQPWWFCRKVLP